MSTNLVIIRGLPGSGKSTCAKQLYSGYLHYEPDYYMCDTNGLYRFDAQLWDLAVDLTYKMVDFALSRDENVVVSDVFPTMESVNPYIELAKYHNKTYDIINTTGNYNNIHKVPLSIINKMKQSWEDF